MSPGGRAGETPPVHAIDARSTLERAVRRAWRRGPGPLPRIAASAHGAAGAARERLYDAGWLPVRTAPVPVVSVGGLTAGGSGKTPLAAASARWLSAEGLRVGILARAEDEARTHRLLLSGAGVAAGRDVVAAARRLAAAGCDVVVIDSGFQHRRLARGLDVVSLSADIWDGEPPRLLPAGPYRERLGALRRAGAVVVVRREAPAEVRDALLERVRALVAGVPVAACRIRPGTLVAANRAAEENGAPDPAVAVAGVMRPETFLAQALKRFPALSTLRAFPDHHAFPARAARALAREAGRRGIVCTVKDAVKLAPRLPPGIPLWFVRDVLEWETGGAELRFAVLAAAHGVPEGGRRCG